MSRPERAGRGAEQLPHFAIVDALRIRAASVRADDPPPETHRTGVAQVLGDFPLAGEAVEDELRGIPAHAQAAELAQHEEFRQAVIDGRARLRGRGRAHDERETRGLREVLNLGHTLGHAIETVTRYRAYKHGEAIAIGMCAAGFISRMLRLWSEEEKIRAENLLAQAGLPTKLFGKLPEREIRDALARDKKVKSGELRYVLPVRIGKVIVQKIPYSFALEGLKYVQP